MLSKVPSFKVSQRAGYKRPIHDLSPVDLPPIPLRPLDEFKPRHQEAYWQEVAHRSDRDRFLDGLEAIGQRLGFLAVVALMVLPHWI